MSSNTILYVDDDPHMRKVIVAILEKPGRDVLSAPGGCEALRVLADRPIDLLITDIRMPGINGFELAHRAKLAQPALRIIYVSGFFSEQDRGSGPFHGILLSKPVNPGELRQQVDQLLSAGLNALQY